MAARCSIVADIGGTNARFACVSPDNPALQQIGILPTAEFSTLEGAIRHYLASLPGKDIDTLCLALAGPVTQDSIQLTNNPWHFSRTALQQSLGMRVAVINDFTAQACCLDLLTSTELDWFGPQRPQGDRMRVIMGPGTGLGVAGIGPGGAILPTEGGHITFAPTDEHQLALLKVLWRQLPRVSAERLVSGPGLSNLYHANSVLAGTPATLTPAQITTGALQGDSLCARSVQDFLDILASVAGDLALALGALDGVYLAGGILPRLGALLDRERFRQRFSAKGRLAPWCAAIPVALARAEHMGLRGCAGALQRGLV